MQDNGAKQRMLAKERSKAERKKSLRIETATALLVCEGECTEPFYLKALLLHLGINSASVEILPGQSHSNAVAVVNRARERFEQAPRDRVFALIDAEQDDLEQAKHPFDLPKRNLINLNIDLNIHGVGGNDTWGAKTLEKYTIKGNKPYQYGFVVEYQGN